MRRLPVIAAGTAQLVLYMSDRSAAALVEVLLSGDYTSDGDLSAPPLDELASALALDPPFFAWIAFHAASNSTPKNDLTVKNLAVWLAENALDVLCRDEFLDGSAAVSSENCDEKRWADRVAEAVEAAEAAWLAADADRQEEAYGIGLLQAAGRWMPEELSAVIGVAKTVKTTDICQRAERLGVEARQKWLQTHPAADLLPKVVEKLAHFENLQRRFDETLLAEKLESMAEFAAGAGHEINNPVAVIAGRAQLFLQGETDPERRRALALINAQAKRVYEMIADMMLFARPPAPTFEKVDLSAIVDKVISELKADMEEQSVTLMRRGDASAVEIEADAEQLNVALRAMCRNSLESMDHDGCIEISVENRSRCVIIRVSDDGPGIPDDVRRHIFDPFFSARQAGRGLGLGLSKCWRIVVTNHGGRIDVDSGPGRRTVFTITLPVLDGRKRLG